MTRSWERSSSGAIRSTDSRNRRSEATGACSRSSRPASLDLPVQWSTNGSRRAGAVAMSPRPFEKRLGYGGQVLGDHGEQHDLGLDCLQRGLEPGCGSRSSCSPGYPPPTYRLTRDELKWSFRRIHRPAPAGVCRDAGPGGQYDQVMAEVRECAQCGTPFTPRREHARFCSTRCRVTWNREHAGVAAAPAVAIDWSVTAMTEAAGRLAAARDWDPARLAAAVAEAVWWVTLVDATLVRYQSARPAPATTRPPWPARTCGGGRPSRPSKGSGTSATSWASPPTRPGSSALPQVTAPPPGHGARSPSPCSESSRHGPGGGS